MRLIAVGLVILVLAAAGDAWSQPGDTWSEAGECLSVWLDTRGQPAECKAVDGPEGLSEHPKVCRASDVEKAVVTIRLKSCREQVAAAAALPGVALAGREFAIRAHAREGTVEKELVGLDGNSWAGALRDLCRAIAVWHANLHEADGAT